MEQNQLFGTKSLTKGRCAYKTPSTAPAFDSLPPASYQQIAHGLGHPLEPALTEPPLGLEPSARPRFGLRLRDL